MVEDHKEGFNVDSDEAYEELARNAKEELQKSINKMSDETFWKWVSTWLDVDFVVDITQLILP